MALPQLNVYRYDRATRALITLVGEIDLTTAPLVSEALAACLRDGVRRIDIDLTAVTFCDASGLNAFLRASRLATDADSSLRLHHPSPCMARVIEITGTGFLLHSLPSTTARSRRTPVPTNGAPRPHQGENSRHRVTQPSRPLDT
ncbi:STAS domain-containing protein [Streptomyces sp. NPDC001388]|uniref:STAS domain-containing protein n=1 Tax=Streptomyces sp. NPDC001388 TaxID=3364568 RepID=UPI0036BBC536